MIKKQNTYDVVFLDYGNWDRVAFTDIHILQRKFASQPAQAIACSLTKVNHSKNWKFIYFFNSRVYQSVMVARLLLVGETLEATPH